MGRMRRRPSPQPDPKALEPAPSQGEGAWRLARCDGCGAMFDVEMVAEPLEDGGRELGFSCPQCQKRFVLSRITARGLELKQQIRDLRIAMTIMDGPYLETAEQELEYMVWDLAGEVRIAKFR